MSLETWFVPLDWPLHERLGGHVAAHAEASDLAAALAAERYFASEEDVRLVAALGDKPGFQGESALLLPGLRTDPATYAEAAARLILAADADARGRWLAQLAQADTAMRFFTPLYLVLAYVSPAYAQIVTGEGEAGEGPAPYDGPQVVADALGGPAPPESALFALRDPAAAGAIADALDALDIAALSAGAPGALRDFHEEYFGPFEDLDREMEDAIDSLRLFYSGCREAGWGGLVQSG